MVEINKFDENWSISWLKARIGIILNVKNVCEYWYMKGLSDSESIHKREIENILRKLNRKGIKVKL